VKPCMNGWLGGIKDKKRERKIESVPLRALQRFITFPPQADCCGKGLRSALHGDCAARLGFKQSSKGASGKVWGRGCGKTQGKESQTAASGTDALHT